MKGNLCRTADAPVEIGAERLPNMNKERYRYANPFGIIIYIYICESGVGPLVGSSVSSVQRPSPVSEVTIHCILSPCWSLLLVNYVRLRCVLISLLVYIAVFRRSSQNSYHHSSSLTSLSTKGGWHTSRRDSLNRICSCNTKRCQSQRCVGEH